WVANLKPPSLACIVPWEGAADQYRDILYHGGIFGSGFIVGWFTTHMAHHMLGRAYESNPDTFQDNVLWRFMRNSLERYVQEPAGAMGQDRSADVGGRQLVRHGTSPARRHRRLHARGIEGQEAAHPLRHALPSVLTRGGRPRR